MAKREVVILCVSDNHAGSRYGLTHPDYIRATERGWLLPLWKWWESEIKPLGEVDCMLHLGDAVDGQGDKDRGVSEMETDVERQGEMAAAALSIVKARTRKIARGTPYHTAGSANYENYVGRLIGAEVADEQFLLAGGLRISARHVVGRSDTPYGQGTLASKEGTRDLLQAMQDDSERADIVLRGHIHTYLWVDNGSSYVGVVPALQLPMGVFGRTQRPWWYRVGFLELRISDGYCQARPHLMSLRSIRRRHYASID